MYRTRMRSLFELLVDRPDRQARMGVPGEVGLRIDRHKPELPHFRHQPPAGGQDLRPIVRQPRLVADGGRGRGNRQRVAVVRVLHLGQLLDHLRLGHEVAEPQPGQRVRLAQRPRHHDLLAPGHQRHAVRLGEIDVRLVDQQRTRQPLGNLQHALRRNHRARGAVRIGQEHQPQVVARPRRNSSGSDQSALNRTSSLRAPCNSASVL